ncbi:hypothetical protein Tco_1171987 [Tanacetum coccineum]
MLIFIKSSTFSLAAPLIILCWSILISRAASSVRVAQGTPTQSAAHSQRTASIQGTATSQGTAEIQRTADFQGTAESSDDDFWKDQEEWEIIRWRFHESSGVHTLEIEDGTMIHMLAERRYPLAV